MMKNQRIFQIMLGIFFVCVSIFLTSTVWSSSSQNLDPGTIVKGQSSDTIYYVGYDGAVHPFLHPGIFFSYTRELDDIVYVSDAVLRQYPIGEAVCVRAGSWLLQFKNQTSIYAVEPGCQLRPLRSQAEAFMLYGSTWQDRVLEIDQIYMTGYSIRPSTQYSHVQDADRDGINKETERTYKTADGSADSDDDGLSDYEEIVIWKIDPTKKDTDADGMSDGEEVMQLRLPNGVGKIERIPEGYVYPKGTVFTLGDSNKNTFYVHPNDEIMKVSDTSSDVFSKSGIHTLFIAHPPIERITSFIGTISASDPLLIAPVRRATVRKL